MLGGRDNRHWHSILHTNSLYFVYIHSDAKRHSNRFADAQHYIHCDAKRFADAQHHHNTNAYCNPQRHTYSHPQLHKHTL